MDSIAKRFVRSKAGVAYVGDDLPDVGLMRRVGTPTAVCNNRWEVARHAVYVTQEEGGTE